MSSVVADVINRGYEHQSVWAALGGGDPNNDSRVSVQTLQNNLKEYELTYTPETGTGGCEDLEKDALTFDEFYQLLCPAADKDSIGTQKSTECETSSRLNSAVGNRVSHSAERNATTKKHSNTITTKEREHMQAQLTSVGIDDNESMQTDGALNASKLKMRNKIRLLSRPVGANINGKNIHPKGDITGRKGVDMDRERLRIMAMRGKGKLKHIHPQESVSANERNNASVKAAKFQESVLSMFSPEVRLALAAASAKRVLGLPSEAPAKQQHPRYLSGLPTSLSVGSKSGSFAVGSKPADERGDENSSPHATGSAAKYLLDVNGSHHVHQPTKCDSAALTLSKAAAKYGPPVSRMAAVPDPYPEVRKFIESRLAKRKRTQSRESNYMTPLALYSLPMIRCSKKNKKKKKAKRKCATLDGQFQYSK